MKEEDLKTGFKNLLLSNENEKIDKEWAKEFYITISPAEFEKAYDFNSGKLLPNKWSAIIRDELIKFYPCPFISKDYNRKMKSRLVAYGRCSHAKDQCKTVYYLRADKPEKHHPVKFLVKITGEIDHVRTNTMQIRGPVRDNIAKDLEFQNPKLFTTKYQSKASIQTKCANNRVIGKDVARKIKSEYDLKKRTSKDPFEELEILMEKMNSDFSNKIFNGFIQAYSAKKFFANFYSAQQIEGVIYHVKSLNKSHDQNGIDFHFDATGSVLRKYPDIEKRVYLYSFVFKSENLILPVCEFITSDHKWKSIARRLFEFYSDVLVIQEFRKFFGKIFRRIIMDFSFAIIKASILVFNHLTLEGYIEQCFNFYYKNTEPPKTIVSLCVSHLMKQCSDICKKNDITKLSRSIVMHGFARYY